MVFGNAEKYFDSIRVSDKDAVVFDIDETSLSNWVEEKAEDWYDASR